MGKPYQNTISGLLRKRAELTRAAEGIREQLAVIGNDLEALDRTLKALGHKGDLKAVVIRGNRIVLFRQGELRRFCLEEMRRAGMPVTTRALSDKLLVLAGKDPRDRHLRIDMVKRVGKSLKLLRKQGLVANTGKVGPGQNMLWARVVQSN
jgi:hypothetical protein